jgi:hypothetical protein
MVFLRLITALALSLAVTALSQAQTRVYESTDAEGNTVFSDTPSAGAKSMEVPPTNVATPVEPEPRAAVVSEGGAAPTGAPEKPEEQVRIIGNGDDERIEGDKWRTVHTESGDILSQEPRRDEGEEVYEPGQRHRVEKHPTHHRGRH